MLNVLQQVEAALDEDATVVVGDVAVAVYHLAHHVHGASRGLRQGQLLTQQAADEHS